MTYTNFIDTESMKQYRQESRIIIRTASGNIVCALVVCCIYLLTLLTKVSLWTNSAEPDQTALI